MRKQAGRGFTMVELVMALVIVAVISTAVAALVAAGGNSSSYVTSTNDAVWQVDNACRRMTYNLRMASALDSPAGTTGTNTFTLHTQKDPSYSNTAQQVIYAVDGNNNLTENDARFGTSALVKNVTSFTVTRLSTTAPTSVQITITAGTTSSVTRTFTVLCRNL